MRITIRGKGRAMNWPVFTLATFSLTALTTIQPSFAENTGNQATSLHRHQRQAQQTVDNQATEETPITADNTPVIDGATLIDVVVSATGFEQNVKDAPASISVISREEIEKGSFHDLTDALRSAQGVAVTGPAGEQDIYMRGLPGEYTLILVDGKRMNTRESRTNGSAGFEQSFIPPASAIERIEVIRGPMSSLYGSDAMGGVINIITRKVPEKWTGSITVDGTANEHSRYGNSYSGSYYAAGPLQPGVIGLQMWGRGFKREEDKILSGTPEKKERDFNGRITITPNENHDLVFEAGTTSLKRYTSQDSKSYNFNDRNHLSFSHTGRWGWTTSEFSVLHETAKRQSWTWSDTAHDYEKSARAPYVRNTVYDGKFTTPFELWGNHTLVTGGQYIQTKLTDQNPGKRDNTDYDFTIDQWALFVEDEWWLTDSFALTGGVRMDHHEIYGTHWSPRAYAVWHATDNLTLKGGITTGFQAPDIRSIVPGYAYTTGGKNCYYGDQTLRPADKSPCAVMIGGKGLEAEKSTSYEFSVLYDSLGGVKLGATYFYTSFKDKIANERAYDANGDYILWAEDPKYSVIYNLNIDKATIQGVELTAAWNISESLLLRANYTYTDSKQETGTYKGFPLARTPEHMANIRVDWTTPIEGLTAWVNGTYHGKETNAGLRIGSNGKPIYKNGSILAREYDDYTTVDIGAAYTFNKHVSVNGAVYNIFDKQVGTDEFNTVMEGRRYWLSMTSNF